MKNSLSSAVISILPIPGERNLPQGDQFHWKSARTGFISDARKLFNYALNAGIGGYYNGNRWYVNGLINYRVQPYGSIGMAMNYNDISLPVTLQQCEADPCGTHTGYYIYR
jgi:hypothetical protein